MKSFSKLGHKVYILVIRPEHKQPQITYLKDEEINVIEIHPSSFLKIKGIKGIGKYINYFLCIPKIFKTVSQIMTENKIDFIYSYMPGIGSSLPAMLLKSKFKIKHVLDFADLHVFVRPKFIANRSFKNADVILVITEYLKNILIKKGIKSDKIIIIPNGVDLELFNPNRYTENFISEFRKGFNGQKIVLFSGALQDINILIDSANEVINKVNGIKFVIVGDHRDPLRSKDSWHKKVIERGLENYFIFVGRKSREEIPLYILSSEVCVDTFPNEPYYAAAHPVKLLEYAACGKPIVATKVSETEKLIKHGVYGYLAEPNNSYQFAEYLITLLNSPKLREKMGRDFFNFVEKNFDWKKIAKKLEMVLKN